jgi:hypothetical protein
MSNRTLIWLTVFFVLATGSLLILNLFKILTGQPDTPQTYIKLNEVRGAAVQYQAKHYTLNFAQQNACIHHLNQVIPIDKNQVIIQQKPEIEQIIIYQFDQTQDLILTPITYIENNLVFSIPQWNPNDYLIEVSNGNLRELLSKTYDP